MSNVENTIKSTVKYPTSLIINGANQLGIELADSLIEQGGYVVIVDAKTPANIEAVERLDSKLLSYVDYDIIPHLGEELRRLDYIFYLAHETDKPWEAEVSTQQFLEYSNYLDGILDIAVRFEAKFLLGTAIKAHQLALQEKEQELLRSSKDKHHTYTEYEIQRYAESLTLEYVEKVSLDARIIRLGELIGDGTNFSQQSNFVKMILAAVNGESIPVVQDGLASDWYIHLLDAVYALVKAQFSRNTAGQIYTVAYEDPISDLALAYKIHDLEPEAGEINFSPDDETKSKLPPLKLYRPATNLNSIGWKPRIAIEEAVKQTLASAKIYLAQKQATDLINKYGDTAKNSTAAKLKSFLQIANSADSIKAVEDDKAQQWRTINITSANGKLRDKKFKRPLTLQQQFSNVLWGIFLGIRSRFKFLDNMTPSQLVFWVVVMLVMTVFYFAVVSPSLVLVRNYYVATTNYDKLSQALSERKLSGLSDELTVIEGATVESIQIISRYRNIANYLGLQAQYTALTELLDVYRDYSSGMRNIADGMQPILNYYENYQDNLFVRSGSDSLLSVEQQKDYSQFLAGLNTTKGLAAGGRTKVQNALSAIDKLDLSSLPTEWQSYVRMVNEQLSKGSEIIELSNVTEYLPQAIGVDKQQNYLVLLQDNTRYSLAGGIPVAYALIEVKNGAIVDTKVQTVTSANLDFNSVESSYRQLINSASFIPKNSSTQPTLADLSLIATNRDYASVMRLLWEKSLGKSIDSVIVMDYQLLDKLISDLNQRGKTISVENQTYQGGDLLINIKNSISGNTNILRKEEVSAQLLANVLEAALGDWSSNNSQLISLLSQQYQESSWRYYMFDEKLASVAKYQKDVAIANSYLRVGVVSDHSDLVTTTIPGVSYQTTMQVNRDSSLSYFVKLKFPNLIHLSQVMLCTSPNSRNVQLAGAVSSRLRLSTVNNEPCLIYSMRGESELSYSWSVAPVASNRSTEYNTVAGWDKQPGVSEKFDLEFTSPEGVGISVVEPVQQSNQQNVIFTEQMKQDLLVKLLLKN